MEEEQAFIAELEALRRQEGTRAGAPVRVELRAAAKEGKVAGYGSVFNVKDDYGDVVVPGAFAASLAEDRRKGRTPLMLWMHDLRMPIGRWDVVREDEKGLFVQGQIISGTQAGKEAIELLSGGAVDGLSIGFRTEEAVYDPEAKIRRVTRIRLFEVSLVSIPANPDARVE